jgi:spermidine synthase
MLMHPNPKTVFIGGGGEGATLREVLKHPSVEKVVMVDIDQDLVEFCKTHLPEWSDGAFEDKRVEVHYADARAYLETRGQSFDVIIMDICDPSKGSECVKLYEQEFYQKLQQNGVLNPGFVLVTQSGPAGLCSLREVGSVIHNTLKQVFRHVVPFGCHVPSFFDRWGFNLACDSKFDRCQTVEQINEELARRRITSKFYDGSCHQALFGLPKTLACIYAEETRVITEKTPCFMNSDYEQTTGELLEE